jgi:hypothetical protein
MTTGPDPERPPLTAEEVEENLRRLHDAIEFHERQINPWAWDEMRDVARRLSRRAIVDCAENDYDMAVGGFSDPTLAETVEALHPDQVRGLCIMLAQDLARTEVAMHMVNRDEEEAVFLEQE